LGAKQFNKKQKGGFRTLILLVAFIGSITVNAQDTTQTGYTTGNMILPTPTGIQDLYTYDPITDRYIYTQTLGDFNITYPLILTPKEYQDLVLKEEIKSYFKNKINPYTVCKFQFF